MAFQDSAISTNYTQTLSDFAYHLKYEDLPAEVVERAKFILIHTFGAALASSGVDMSRKAIETGEAMNGGEGGGATAWIKGTPLSMANAAFVNGTLSDMLDWEDCAWTGHPAAGVIPAAWAAAEAQKKGGKELLTAIVAAYEVYTRIAMAVQDPKGQEAGNGWGLVSWQIFGAIIPAAKLLGLDPGQINQAIGFGTSCSTIPASLHNTTMSDAYHYEHGFRAHSGIAIAHAVKNGVMNYQDALDYKTAYAIHMTPDEDPTWYTRELGTRWLIMETLLKHWPCNMWVQTPVELASILTAKYSLKPEEIEEIVIDPPTAKRMAFSPSGYTSLTHAQFSIPYVVSAAIHHPRPGAYWYSPENMTDPSILSLAGKVHAGPSPQHTLRGSFKLMQDGSYPVKTLTIRTYDGRVLSETMDRHPGHPYNMMSRDELSDRFFLQSEGVYGHQKAEQALAAFWDVENCEDISSLAHFLHR